MFQEILWHLLMKHSVHVSHYRNMTHAYDSFLVAAIAKFRDEQDCMDFLNQARVGLAGYFFSRDPGQIWRVAEAMEVSTGHGPEVNYLTGSNVSFKVGIVGCNTGMLSCCEAPFGGYKESGLGREGSLIGTEEYLETKYLCIADC